MRNDDVVNRMKKHRLQLTDLGDERDDVIVVVIARTRTTCGGAFLADTNTRGNVMDCRHARGGRKRSRVDDICSVTSRMIGNRRTELEMNAAAINRHWGECDVAASAEISWSAAWRRRVDQRNSPMVITMTSAGRADHPRELQNAKMRRIRGDRL